MLEVAAQTGPGIEAASFRAGRATGEFAHTGAQVFIDAGHRVSEQSTTNGHSNGHAEPVQSTRPETPYYGVQVADAPRHPSGFRNYQEQPPAR